MILRLLVGRGLTTSEAGQERLSRIQGIGAFGLDALSSVAYGPDEILYVLLLAGTAGMLFDLPIAFAITGLLAVVAISYRQTIFAYPKGGGSYTVASENLGVSAGLVAAAALMVDYLTTVAVSVTAGVEAIIAFVPAVEEHRVLAAVVAVTLLVLINVRGVREAGMAFVLPTYFFIGSLALLIVIGLIRLLTGFAPESIAPPQPAEDISVFLVLRAFAGGCTAMTGVEAIANGVPAFKDPRQQNAAATLMFLAGTLALLFLGVTVLGAAAGAVPSGQANVIAQVARAFVGGSPLYYMVLLASALILLLAANTSFNGFPRLAAIMAEDDYFPHQFSHRGLRLAYSNGIAVTGLLAIFLVVAFGGATHALIPLFAVGVFLCFTLSQAGMVRHWWRLRGSGWRRKLLINASGGAVTGAVTLVVVATKFVEGAWIVLLLVPLLAVTFWAVHRHYTRARLELAAGNASNTPYRDLPILVPVHTMDRSVAAALQYALSVSRRVTAIHIAVDEDGATRFRDGWQVWAPQVPLEVVPSPYREVVSPFVERLDRECLANPGSPVTVVLPEVVPHHVWEEPLHNQLGWAIKLALFGRPGVVVISVPIKLRTD